MYGIFSRYIAGDGGIGAYPNFLQVIIFYTVFIINLSLIKRDGGSLSGSRLHSPGNSNTTLYGSHTLISKLDHYYQEQERGVSEEI